MGDDDWFERALRDDDSEATDGDGSAAADDGPDADPSDADGGASAAGTDADADDELGSAADAEADAAEADAAGEPAERPEESRSADDEGGSDADPFGGVRAGPPEPPSESVAGGRPSEDSDGETTDPDSGAADDGGGAGESNGEWDDFGSALENAPGPNRSESGPAESGADPFGGGSGGPLRDRSGGFGPDDGGGFRRGGGDFDAAGPPQGGPEEFDEEDFESEIDRLDIGIDGLDEMILGGVPVRSLMVAIGSAGTGKTTLGLQFLNCALEAGDSAAFITLEESRERILDTAEEKGWQFREYESEGRLAVVDLDPVEMANSLESIQSDLPRLVEEFGADRLVLDSVSLLEMMYDRPSKRRTRVFNFARSLKEAGVTTMLTSEASDDNPYVSRHGIVEYLADAVFVLQYVRPDDFRETRLAIEIQKIRDANHSRETKPYELTSDGISVYGRANIF
ncbi:KaiC domain-containing protein [Halopelagius longus]|uniref:KaiC domain-containing protein n=1 Tax=Halopelagius longus TaxID=1236180 RepID=A0A370IQY3_9EURY|nr:KaiC domain-containing protein [Halopelagius longus]RDI73123.1 KaiC domain-containing protein [Halopelagius longus]